MWATSEFQLGEGGLEVFDDLCGNDVGIRKVSAVFERFVFAPKDVEVEFVALSHFFGVGEGSSDCHGSPGGLACVPVDLGGVGEGVGLGVVTCATT